MKLVENIITGIWYDAYPVNTEIKNLYPDIEKIRIKRETVDECKVWLRTKKLEEKPIYTGSRGACENWTLLTFNLEKNAYALSCALDHDIDFLNKTENPVYMEIADRIKGAREFVISERDNQYAYITDLEAYYKERSKLEEYRVKELSKETSPEDREAYWNTEDAIDSLDTKYAKLIGIQAEQAYGQVNFTEDFGRDIDEGFISDDDGCANFLDEDGNEGPSVSLWPGNWKIKDIDKYPYIVFFGK